MTDEPIRTVSYSAKLTTMGDGNVRIVIVHRGQDIVNTIVSGIQPVMDLADKMVAGGRSISMNSEIRTGESVVCVVKKDPAIDNQ